MSDRILYLVDTVKYVQENCFQKQLFSAMRYGYDITPFEVLPDRYFHMRRLRERPESYGKVISVLRLRTLHKVWPRLKAWLGNTPLTIYDQDPWESYIDGAPTKGIYKTLLGELNLSKVYVTAPWWAEHLRRDGVPADFVRMGMEPRYCDAGPDFDDRPTLIGFRGAMHEHRKIVFNKLEAVGINVTIDRERLDYLGYMNYLQRLKIFAHDEAALPWVCDGVPIPRSTGMWIKSVETAARGTFCLRNYHEEGEAYNLSKLPLIQCYHTPEEAPEIINKILSLSKTKRRDMQIETVDLIRSQHDWLNAAHKLVTGN